MDHVSPLDTSRFGFKIAKINNLDDLKFETLLKLKHDDAKLVISRVPSENIQLINQMEDWGYRIKDVQLTYKFDLHRNDIQYQYLNEELIVREALPKDIDKLRIIAEDCFLNYGHYFADKNLDKKNCMDVYKDWTQRAVQDPTVADKMFVAVKNEEVIGYLFFKINELNNQTYAYSGLGAVYSKSRGKNVFSTLCIRALEWGRSQNHDWQEHNVLNINYPVNKVFAKLGFSNYKSETTLHLWLDDLKEK